MFPNVKLKATVIPKSLARVTVLGDILANFGLPPDVVATAQRGLAENLINGMTIRGIGWDGYIKDEARIMFDDLKQDMDLSVDTFDGKSMVEALSVKLAHAVSYSISTMKRKGLNLNYLYHFPASAADSNGRYDHALSRLGLVASEGGSDYEPGYAPKQIFEVRPGSDTGIHYAHATAQKKNEQ